MWVVTPSIRLDGTAARPIQRRRRHVVISSEGVTDTAGAGVTCGLCPGLPRLIAVLRAAVTTGAGAVAVTAVLVEGVPPSSGGGTGCPSDDGSTGGPSKARRLRVSPAGFQISAA